MAFVQFESLFRALRECPVHRDEAAMNGAPECGGSVRCGHPSLFPHLLFGVCPIGRPSDLCQSKLFDVGKKLLIREKRTSQANRVFGRFR